ncbi:MAG: triose-phosphate isomerase [Clostridia bacterium]|nr:triose-phosphate isomerase [Clostridia bacterium]
MNRAYRKTIIAGNWKMNKTPAETRALINELRPLVQRTKWCETVVCVPFVDLPNAIKAVRGCRISVGAQNMHYEASGAYTGEVSAEMLTSLGVKYVIIGHSERRQYFGETNETVNKKVLAAGAAGLRPILCVGESLEEREADITNEVITTQLKIALRDVDAAAMKKIVIAYEPIWAIGTGKTATSDQAEEICNLIRAFVRSKYGARVARAVSILYGGSMKASNAAELLSKPDVDGGLIGGASLKASDFSEIVHAANQ